ncbi:unnamed protein product [Calicophoron daubneyi]|uniref:Phosphomevalonate kinase n=1 Tax=Calicophoron daubneyi TaxID=300641 RepID=A0AAV2TRD8_CALDB
MDGAVTDPNDCRSSVCLVFSGKRKSGKDFTVKLLTDMLAQAHTSYVTLHLSEPIKSYYAAKHNLNLVELMSSGTYKESYRKQMVEWGEEQMRHDPHIFARKSLSRALSDFPPSSPPRLIVVADARRLTDLDYFSKVCGRPHCLFIRICASDQIRAERGWTFVSDIDDATTECGLDGFGDWDFVLLNDECDSVRYQEAVKEIIDRATGILHKLTVYTSL